MEIMLFYIDFMCDIWYSIKVEKNFEEGAHEFSGIGRRETPFLLR